jgi:hypothetical protein
LCDIGDLVAAGDLPCGVDQEAEAFGVLGAFFVGFAFGSVGFADGAGNIG